MENLDQQNKYFRAKERVEEIKKFYGTIGSSVVTIALVASLNYYLNEWRNPWFLWVVLGFGLSLTFKALKIFDMYPFMNKDWEERKIQEFMKQDENRKDGIK